MLALPYEIWRDIPGYEGYYQVSNLGTIKSVNRYVKSRGGVRLLRSQIMKPIFVKPDGKYIQVVVTLYNNGVKKRVSISRIVAEVYIPNPLNKPEVDHINTDSTDNRVENLRWVTYKEQHNNPLTKQHLSESMKGKIPWDKGVEFTDEHKTNISNALKGKYCSSKNPNSKRIKQLTKDGELIKIWDYLKDAVDELGISQPNISNVLTGRHKTAGGYVWEYADN